MDFVSFIILTYNSEKYIKECIQSIRELKKIKYEVIVCDNGSKDNSCKIVKDFMDNNIHLIVLDKNYGTTISRNKGISLAKGEYICILDSDTEINEYAIQYMINYLKKYEDVGIVGPSMKNAKGEKQIPYRKFPNFKLKIYKALPVNYFNKKGIEMEKISVKEGQKEVIADYLISACWCMPKSTIQKVGMLDERIFYSPEDVEFCIRVWKNNLKVVHLTEPLILHYYQRISKKALLSRVNFSHFYCLLRMLYENRKFLKYQNSKKNY